MKRVRSLLRSAFSQGVRFLAREIADEQQIKAIESVPAPALTAVRDRAPRIIFIALAAESWDSLDSVWRAFAADPICQTTVVAVTDAEHLQRMKNNPRDELIRRDIPFVTSEYYDLANHRPDVVFLEHPYDGMFPPNLRFAQLRRQVARLVYVPYGFEIGGGTKRLTTQFNNPAQQQTWRVFVRSERFKRLYRKKCAAGDAHVVVSGHPMVDAVLNRSRESADPVLKNFVGERKSILWTPHYGETRDQSDFSTFLRWKDLLLEIFAKRADMVLILRPHPFLFSHLVTQGFMSAGEIEAFQKRFINSPNMILDESTKFTSAFAVSSALMSDAASFLTLYGVTTKPIQYLPNPTGPGLNEEGEIVKLYYSGDTPAAIQSYVEMVGRGEDPMREKRLAGFGEFLCMPKEGAGVFIKNYVMDALQRGV